jgi:hypothetical protein
VRFIKDKKRRGGLDFSGRMWTPVYILYIPVEAGVFLSCSHAIPPLYLRLFRVNRGSRAIGS